MKTQTNHSLSIQKIAQGFILSVQSRKLSPHTVADYANTLNKFISHVGEGTPFQSIDHHHVESFLRSVTGVTNKTLLNYHIGLSSLYTWAVRERLVDTHVLRQVRPPKPERREILPFSEEDIRAMLNGLSRSKIYARPGKLPSDHALPEAHRMRAMILVLLDTGIRASEMTRANIHQIDKTNQRIQVFGKGAQERSIPLSPRTLQAIWRYLADREDPKPDAPLFVTSVGRAIDRTALGKMLKVLGNRAGVSNVHPHRFRHTFAIQYLRNGGDPYTLQRLLGHSTLDMVKVYLQLAQIDLDKAHRRASPVDNWAL